MRPLDQLLEIIQTYRNAKRRTVASTVAKMFLCSMLGLAREIDNLRLAPFCAQLCRERIFRCADDFAFDVCDRPHSSQRGGCIEERDRLGHRHRRRTAVVRTAARAIRRPAPS